MNGELLLILADLNCDDCASDFAAVLRLVWAPTIAEGETVNKLTRRGEDQTPPF